MPESSLITLYYSLVHCHLVYASEIWSCCIKSDLDILVKKQKAAIRIITNSRYNDHTEPLFKKTRILPLHKLVLYFKLKFIHSVIYKLCPAVLNDTWITNYQSRFLQNAQNVEFAARDLEEPPRMLRNDDLIHVPFARTNLSAGYIS